MLLHFPPEVLTQVLLLLPLKSILVCKKVNRYIRNLISESIEIQYLVQQLLSEQVDNSHCSLSTTERLALLKKRNRSKGINPQLKQKIKIPFETSGFYDLTGGIYLLVDAAQKTLHYMHLSDKNDLPNNEEIEWRGKEVHMEHTIVDMGLSVYENDLLVVITMQLRDNEQASLQRNLFNICMHFYQVSTASPHPNARRPVISVMQVEEGRPTVGIEIVGNNLVLILAYSVGHHKPDNRMFIYDWKSGVLKMSFRAPHHTYSSLIFLTQDVFLTPNLSDGTLEYWRIPEEQSDAPTRPFFKLALPALYAPHRMHIDGIECRAEPNPTHDFHYSPKPFHPDPHRATAVFNSYIRSRESYTTFLFADPIPIFCKFFLFIHRNSLVECLDRFKGFISHHRYPTPVLYNDWGPGICRWLPADGYSTGWIMISSGQTCVLFPDMVNPDPESSSLESITLLDFNQTEVARVLAIREHAAESLEGDELLGRWTDEGTKNHGLVQQGGTLQCEDEDKDDDWVEESDEEIIIGAGEKLDDYGVCFLSDVYGDLPFKKWETSPSYAYSGVLLDEQRIIGMRGNVHEVYYRE